MSFSPLWANLTTPWRGSSEYVPRKVLWRNTGLPIARWIFSLTAALTMRGIRQAVNEKTKLVTIQRSKGYQPRKTLSVKRIGELISFIKSIKPDVICMVDNCYGEFVEVAEPSDVGADLCVGSLIKNPGGGLAPIGGYIAGKKGVCRKRRLPADSSRPWQRSGGHSWGQPLIFPGTVFIAPGRQRGVKGRGFCRLYLRKAGI